MVGVSGIRPARIVSPRQDVHAPVVRRRVRQRDPRADQPRRVRLGVPSLGRGVVAVRQREVAAGFWFLVFGFGIFVFVFAVFVRASKRPREARRLQRHLPGVRVRVQQHPRDVERRVDELPRGVVHERRRRGPSAEPSHPIHQRLEQIPSLSIVQSVRDGGSLPPPAPALAQVITRLPRCVAVAVVSGTWHVYRGHRHGE
mmetsp:Transcript_7373/g.20323  ORF Transcript_7373/g.20323 Transcript_7373/m.20323 type:complete len:200 (-) Transcript_7373:595-1194(-)